MHLSECALYKISLKYLTMVNLISIIAMESSISTIAEVITVNLLSTFTMGHAVA
jgi:hypothetical protein